jgi:hypothetical protein
MSSTPGNENPNPFGTPQSQPPAAGQPPLPPAGVPVPPASAPQPPEYPAAPAPPPAAGPPVVPPSGGGHSGGGGDGQGGGGNGGGNGGKEPRKPLNPMLGGLLIVVLLAAAAILLWPSDDTEDTGTAPTPVTTPATTPGTTPAGTTPANGDASVTQAQTAIRTLVPAIETCFKTSQDYTKCLTAPALGNVAVVISQDPQPGQVRLKAKTTSYAILAPDASGRSWVFKKTAGSPSKRTCEQRGNTACESKTW